jgi:hypothetical protein
METRAHAPSRRSTWRGGPPVKSGLPLAEATRLRSHLWLTAVLGLGSLRGTFSASVVYLAYQRGLSRWAFLLVKGVDTAHSGPRIFKDLAGSRGPVPGAKTAFTCPT